MRDPERIHVVTKALEECWRDFPDMRFGQLIDNIVTYDNRKTRTEVWNMEEDEWLECIRKFRENNMMIYPTGILTESSDGLTIESLEAFKEWRNRS